MSDEEWAQAPLVPPILTEVTPTEIHLGDDMVILGRDFPHSSKGTMSLRLNGSFVADDGQEYPYSGEVPLVVSNPGVARYAFEVVIFHPTYDRIGTFQGMAQLVTRPLEGAEVASPGPLESGVLPTGMRVGPSLLVRRLRPSRSNICAATVGSTTQNQDLELEIQALGFGQASPGAPWEYRLITNGKDLDVRYAASEAVGMWPQYNFTAEVRAPATNHSIIFSILAGDSMYINPAFREHEISLDTDLVVGTGLSGAPRRTGINLTKFASGDLRPEERSLTKNFVVALRTADGSTIERMVRFDVGQQLQMGVWDQTYEVVERTPAVPVTGCARAGVRELQVNYDESYTLTLESAIGYREDIGGGNDAGVQAGNLNWFQLHYSKHWNSTFSTDVQSRISESRHIQRTVSSPVIPSYAYIWYRQETKTEFRVPVYYQNECGRRVPVGEAVYQQVDHAVQPDQGPECDPPTTMPPPIFNARPMTRLPAFTQ